MYDAFAAKLVERVRNLKVGNGMEAGVQQGPLIDERAVAKVTLGPAPSEGNNCIGTGGGSVNTHWFTGPYEQGTTEGGSSGSGVWIPAGDSSGAGRRLIGVLSGGTALCAGTLPDNGYDCYGKFSAGWNGPAASSRLRDWLDPASSGTLSVGGRPAC